MAKIFISHSSKNKDFVRELALDLKELGHKPWLDEWEIKVGECIVTKIEEGIVNSNYVIIILTPDSVNSGWVEREWKTAYWTEIESNKIKILPALLEECELPGLLKTKKYADFKTRYSVGFSQLVQAIIPVDIENDANKLKNETINNQEISAILAKIHGRKIPLSQAIVETLSVASKYNDAELIEFCKNELAGWDRSTVAEDKLLHRLSEMYCSFGKINTQYFGWDQHSSNVFSYMEQNKDEFFPYKLLIGEPISSLEQKDNYDPDKTMISWAEPITAIIEHPKNPEAVVFCYARSDSFKNVLEAIRIELTKRLLKLLPESKS